MNELQALVTGTLAGALMKIDLVNLDVHTLLDEDGNYKPEVMVTGRNSGTRLLVRVEVIEK